MGIFDFNKPKSLLFSIFIAPFRKYNRDSFDSDYFIQQQLIPDDHNQELIDSYLKFFKPRNVLDAGCGTGNLVHQFRKQNVDAYGTDLSENAINFSSVDVKPFLQVGSISALDYPDNEFDLVTCCEVLEHIPFPECEQVIKEIHRVSKKWVLFKICLWADRNARLDPTHINLKSKRWWTRYFKKNHFNLISTPNGFPARRNSYIIKKISN